MDSTQNPDARDYGVTANSIFELRSDIPKQLQPDVIIIPRTNLDLECEKRQRAKADEMRPKLNGLQQFENARRKELQEFVDAWEKAERIRAYLSAVEDKIKSNSVAPSNPETCGAWMEWAHSIAYRRLRRRLAEFRRMSQSLILIVTRTIAATKKIAQLPKMAPMNRQHQQMLPSETN